MAKFGETAPTAPLSFWDDKFWHCRVHQRLGETLTYYIVRVRPLNSEEVVRRLQDLLVKRRLGSVRVFPVFGAYDFIIRAWLHSGVFTDFSMELNSILDQLGYNSVHQFRVEEIDRRWYQSEVDAELLSSIHDDIIRELQAGQNPELLKTFLDKGLVLQRGPTGRISFFVCLKTHYGIDLREVVGAIEQYLDGHPSIQQVSIYRGIGTDYSILVKGQVENYFNIAGLPNWIGSQRFVAYTETFLAHGANHVIGDEMIGEGTFLALRGRHLFVQSIIPELYDLQSPKTVSVALFLIENVRNQTLCSGDKQLLRDYLLAYLEDRPTKMESVISSYTSHQERYLRENHEEFIGRKTGKPVKEIYVLTHIPENSWKHLTLYYLLQLYSFTINMADDSKDHENLVGRWDDLPQIRNDIAHLRLEIESSWSALLARLIRYLSRLRQLHRLIEAVTGNRYNGPYEESQQG
jgi:hypothetical protein